MKMICYLGHSWMGLIFLANLILISLKILKLQTKQEKEKKVQNSKRPKLFLNTNNNHLIQRKSILTILIFCFQFWYTLVEHMVVTIMHTFLTDWIGIALTITVWGKHLDNRLENMGILANNQVMEQMLIYCSTERRKLLRIVWNRRSKYQNSCWKKSGMIRHP